MLHKVICKLFLLCLPCLTIAAETEKKSLLISLWGKSAPTSLTAGFIAYHYNNIKKKEEFFYPGLSFSKSGFFIGALKNTWGKFTLGLGVDRVLFERKTSSNRTYSIGYLLGMSFFGYCWFDYQCKKKDNVPIQPIVAPYIDYIFPNKMGMQLGILGSAVSLAFKIKFR